MGLLRLRHREVHRDGRSVAGQRDDVPAVGFIPHGFLVGASVFRDGESLVERRVPVGRVHLRVARADEGVAHATLDHTSKLDRLCGARGARTNALTHLERNKPVVLFVLIGTLSNAPASPGARRRRIVTEQAHREARTLAFLFEVQEDHCPALRSVIQEMGDMVVSRLSERNTRARAQAYTAAIVALAHIRAAVFPTIASGDPNYRNAH